MKDSDATKPTPTLETLQEAETGMPQVAAQSEGMSRKDELLWATLAHAGTFAGVLVPLGNVIAPLAIYLIKREESAYIAEHAKESLNFQISLIIYYAISFILMFVFIGIIGMLVLFILWLVFVIQASMAAHKGDSFRYPMTIRFVK